MHSPRKNLTLPWPPNGSQILNPCNHTCKCYNPKPQHNPKPPLHSLRALKPVSLLSLCRRNSNRMKRAGRRDSRDLPAKHNALGASIGHGIGWPAVGNPCRAGQQESDANCGESVGCGGGMAGEEMEVKRRGLGMGEATDTSAGGRPTVPCNGPLVLCRPTAGRQHGGFKFLCPRAGREGKPLGLARAARPVPARAPALYSTQMPMLCS
jgi:hypothetical protein